MDLSEKDRLAIVDWAASLLEVKEVYLFGSRARSSSHPDSDIDLALVFRDSERNHNQQLADFAMFDLEHSVFLAERLTHQLDLRWIGLPRVKRGVEKDGVLVYPTIKEAGAGV